MVLCAMPDGASLAASPYPTKKTGTSQDLLRIVTRAYERHCARENIAVPIKGRLSRLFLELPFVLAGASLARALELLPAGWAMSFHDTLFRTVAGGRNYPFNPASPALLRARALAVELERRTGKAPALVALISHPPVLGELAHLNFELVRHAMRSLREVRGRDCRPRLVVAIDPFALDTVSLPVEGLYAGFMGLYHLGLDRLAFSRRPESRLVLRATAWHRMVHRLLRRLGRGGEVGMVLAGGVPSTTRVLYAVREWMREARRGSARRESPSEVLKRLRQVESFARFERLGPENPGVAKSAWRMTEAWAMALLAGVFPDGAGGSCAEAGKLDDAARRALGAGLAALGLEPAAAAASLDRLADELGRETPYRRRFFRVLAGRVARERPVVLVPIIHRIDGGLSVGVDEAWGWVSSGRERLTVLRGDEGAPARQMSPDEFALLFGREHFR